MAAERDFEATTERGAMQRGDHRLLAVLDLLQQAEEEAHHPDFCVHYNRVDFTLWTHAVGGLSENDFILAAKIDAILA